MKLIIAGGRDFNDYDLLCNEVILLLEQSITPLELVEIVSGGASGADKLGEVFAQEYKLPVKRFPADWKTFGRAAGPIRNSHMAKYGSHLVAFWDGKSRGTANMMKLADENGLICKTVIFDNNLYE